jgi:hypothetical protein
LEGKLTVLELKSDGDGLALIDKIAFGPHTIKHILQIAIAKF